MAEISFWEKRFVENYIVPEKQDRYLGKLKGPKHRQEILELLNHALDYRQETATLLSQKQRTAEEIVDLLRKHRVADSCYIMADGSRYDGKDLRIELAAEEMLGNTFGFVMICPPVPIAVYKQEVGGDVLFLTPPHGRRVDRGR